VLVGAAKINLRFVCAGGQTVLERCFGARGLRWPSGRLSAR